MEDSFFKDALEIFKALTPFILALIVYLIWHKQKAKEVVASEAKNTLAILNSMLNKQIELLNTLYELEFCYLKGADATPYHEKVRNQIDELVAKNQEIYQSIMFVCDAKNSLKLQEVASLHYDSIITALRKIRSDYTRHNLIQKESRDEVIASRVKHQKIIHVSILELKNEMLGFALYKN